MSKIAKDLKQFEFSISSSRNVNFKFKETFTLDDMGFDGEEWDYLSSDEKEEELSNYCQSLAAGYIDWSWDEIG